MNYYYKSKGERTTELYVLGGLFGFSFRLRRERHLFWSLHWGMIVVLHKKLGKPSPQLCFTTLAVHSSSLMQIFGVVEVATEALHVAVCHHFRGSASLLHPH